MVFPTIFDWLERLDSLRGFTAAYAVLITAVLVIILWDWRLALAALAAQYFFAGLLFVDVLDPRLAMVKLLAGWFACLILYFTARQVNWGGRPQDVAADELQNVAPERTFQVGPLRIPTSLPLRLLLVLLMLWLITSLFQRPDFALPAIGDSLNYLSLAIFALVVLGLLALALTSEPLKAGMGVFMFLTGFELFYSALDQSATMLILLAAANLVLALVVAYLVQMRHAIPALVD
ncbi:MAG: hypothetical protein H6654_11905 [Ardenticatenaceae bacterium]|nr:hypothetical protein [Anaerolineales bacterium]MCB8937685.1 hypothetical protein [Ardenticatenaceae bacterium]MCB8974254.1 hypothetical protein [Ardenticatenaceae bacterium]